MGSQSIIAAIDKEIARLREVRKVLARNGKVTKPKGGSKAGVAHKKAVKRKLSPEARERIAAAQRKRWAAARKANK
jgi:uncharacterized protein (DUF2384 family)